jgi:hypothetical protein
MIAAVVVCVSGAAVAGEGVTLFDGAVMFTLPDGFKEMSREMINLKYARGNPPQYAYIRSGGSTSIAITHSQSTLTPDQLGEFADEMGQAFERIIGGLEWIDRGVVTINGRTWARMEMMSNAIDTEIHNILLITSFQDRPLMMNFNSTIREFDEMEAGLNHAIQSLQVM